MRDIEKFCIEQAEIDMKNAQMCINNNFGNKYIGILIGKAAAYMNVLIEILKNEKNKTIRMESKI